MNEYLKGLGTVLFKSARKASYAGLAAATAAFGAGVLDGLSEADAVAVVSAAVVAFWGTFKLTNVEEVE